MDTDTATVKYLREALGTHFGVDLAARKQFIKDTVDRILAEPEPVTDAAGTHACMQGIR